MVDRTEPKTRDDRDDVDDERPFRDLLQQLDDLFESRTDLCILFQISDHFQSFRLKLFEHPLQ